MSADPEMPSLALLSGGLAKRLLPLTEGIPKALVPIAGVPFIDHQLKTAAVQGVRRVVVCAGHRGDQIRRHVGDASRFGLEVVYSFDGDPLLGTGGALRKALPLLGPLFWVMYGDSYLEEPFAPILEFFRSRRKPGLMTVLRNENRWDKSNVLFRDGEILRYDKRIPAPEMLHIDYGLGLLRHDALERRNAGTAFDLADLYADLLASRDLIGYEVHTRFHEIGSPAGLAETEAYLRARTEGRERGGI